MSNHKVVEEVINKIKSLITNQTYKFESHECKHELRNHTYSIGKDLFSIDHDLRILNVTSDIDLIWIMSTLYLDGNLPSGITYHLSYHGIPKGTFKYDSSTGIVHYSPLDPVEYAQLKFTIPTSGND